MVELNGWMTVRHSASPLDEEETKYEKIKSNVASIQMNSGVLISQFINGEYKIVISQFTNHRSPDIDDVIDLYYRIAEIASGSYGLLYIRDDEDVNGEANLFKVLVLTRGKITQREDTFLSPFIPTVEDFDDAFVDV